MNSSLIFIPFLAIIVLAVGELAASSYAANAFVIKIVGRGLAVLIAASWLFLDRKGLLAVLNRKGSKYGASSLTNILLCLVGISAVAYLSQRPRFDISKDLTKGQNNSISEESIKLLKTVAERGEKIDVRAFFEGPEEKARFKDLFDTYQRHADFFNVAWKDTQADIVEAQAAKLTSGNTVIFARGTQEARVTEFTEEKITNALVKVLKDGAKLVYFTTGHGEPELKGQKAESFDIASQELESNLYQTKTISLIEQEIPADAEVLVVAGAQYDIRPEEVTKLENYLKSGKSLFVIVDAAKDFTNLNSLTQKFGLSIENDLLVLPPNHQLAMILGRTTSFVTKFDSANQITKEFGAAGKVAILFANSRTIQVNESNEMKFKTEKIAETADGMQKIKSVVSQKDLGQISEDRMENGSFTVLGLATGKADGASGEEAKGKESKLLVAGSTSIIANSGLREKKNLDLFMNSISFLLNDSDFISIQAKTPEKGQLDALTPTAGLQLTLISFIYPFLFLFSGSVIWLIRRKA